MRLVLLCGGFLLPLTYFAFHHQDSSTSDDAYFVRLESAVRALQPQLEAHATEVSSGRIRQQSGYVTFPPPALPSQELSVRAVTKDANENIYFVFADSTVFANVGIVRRVVSTELLGDQMEPRISFTRHLFGDWWYYTAH